MPHPLKEESWTIRSTLFFMPSNRKRYFCHQITNLLYNCKHYLMLSNWKVTFIIELWAVACVIDLQQSLCFTICYSLLKIAFKQMLWYAQSRQRTATLNGSATRMVVRVGKRCADISVLASTYLFLQKECLLSVL